MNDSAKASSKAAGTAIASVLANDFLGNVRATITNVKLSSLSLTPPSNLIKTAVSGPRLVYVGYDE